MRIEISGSVANASLAIGVHASLPSEHQIYRIAPQQGTSGYSAQIVARSGDWPVGLARIAVIAVFPQDFAIFGRRAELGRPAAGRAESATWDISASESFT
jgi:hypothetical protein